MTKTSMQARVVVCVAGLTALAAGLAFAQDRKAYVSDTDSGTVTIVNVDTMAVIGTIGVGQSPRGSAVHPDQSKVYVVNQHAEDVIVLETAGDTVVTRTPVGGRPFRCGISPDGATLYVACHTSDDVWKFLTSDNTAASVIDFGAGGTQDVRVSPIGGRYLAMNNNTSQVAFVGTADDVQIGNLIDVGFEPHAVAFSVGGGTAIVVGEGDTKFIEVATGTVLNTVFANGEHEEVRVFGNLAYATNLAVVEPQVPGKDGGPKAAANPGDTTIDVFDMTTHQLVDQIVLGGQGANGLALSPDGTLAWVTMRTSNELREADLVNRVPTGRVVPVGLGPRSVSVVVQSTETPVVSYMLPQIVKLTIKGTGKDSMLCKGFFDDGALTVNYANSVTVMVADYTTPAFTLIAKGKNLVSPKDPTFKFLLKPNLKSSSKGKFIFTAKKTTLGGVVPTDGEVVVQFSATGLPECTGTLRTSGGRYRIGKRPGDLQTPPFFAYRATAKLGTGATDTLFLRGGFASTGVTPTTLGPVRLEFGGTFARTLPGASFVNTGDVFRHTANVAGSKLSVAIDFKRERVTVKASKIELGDLPGPTTDIVFDAGAGKGAASLARLRRDEGRADAARAALAPVLARFSEGRASGDLVAARALAAELA